MTAETESENIFVWIVLDPFRQPIFLCFSVLFCLPFAEDHLRKLVRSHWLFPQSWTYVFKLRFICNAAQSSMHYTNEDRTIKRLIVIQTGDCHENVLFWLMSCCSKNYVKANHWLSVLHRFCLMLCMRVLITMLTIPWADHGGCTCINPININIQLLALFLNPSERNCNMK